MEWITATFAIGIILLCMEVYVPGGILGTIGVLSLIASSYMVFDAYGLGVGLSYLGAVTVVAVVGLYVTYRLVPRTRVGRSLFLSETESGFSSSREDLSSLIGREGIALTQLRPAGKAEIGGRRVDVVTEGGMVEKGGRVKVLEVEGARVVVREIEI